MARFFKTSREMSKILINSGLTAAEWRIWCYLSDIDPFGDEYVELPPMVDILNECGISDRTFYRAIAKFKGTFFDFQYDKAYIRNLHNNFVADKNGSTTDKNGSTTDRNGSSPDKNGRASIYSELQNDQTLSEAREKIETFEISNATRPTLSEIPKIKINSLVKAESGNGENFPAAAVDLKNPEIKVFDWLPDGPWKIDGKLDPNFRDFVANDWLKRFGGDIHSKRADVLSHFKKDPANLPIRWEQYQSEYLNRYENTQILLSNGIEIKPEYQDRLIDNQRAITAQLPQELNPVLQQSALATGTSKMTAPQLPASSTPDLSLSKILELPQSEIAPSTPDLSLSKILELPQAVKTEDGQTFKVFRAADIEIPPEQAKANREFLSDALKNVFGNTAKKDTPATMSLLEQLNVWINDPFLRQVAINQVNRNSDRFECLFNDEGVAYHVIEKPPIEEEPTSKKSLLDKLNLWINDPILRESTVAEVNRNCDRFQCLFDTDGVPYQVIEISKPTTDYEYDF
jgi:hypothetical protein